MNAKPFGRTIAGVPATAQEAAKGSGATDVWAFAFPGGMLMKTIGKVVLVLVAVAMLVCIVLLVRGYRRQSAQYAESRLAEEAVREQFNAALESIAEVQDSLAAIAPAEAHLMDLSRAAEMGAQVTGTQKERMLNTIADIRTSIRNTRQRVRDLERNLESSHTEVAGLRKIVEGLKRSVAEKEATIQQLSGMVDSLVVTVAGLRADVIHDQETIVAQQQVIEERRQEIGTVYYTIGTKRDLKTRGIIVERGGIIGIGKSVHLSGSLPTAGFIALDTDRVKEIAIAGKEPKVLSSQSDASYELQAGEGGATLRILDAREFRKVKYVVIMVK